MKISQLLSSFLLGKIRSIRESLAARMRKEYIAKLMRNGLRCGQNVNFAADFFLDPSHCFLISIGNNVTFAPNVRLIAHDASTKLFIGFTRIGMVQIMDNCFIGDSVIVLPGVKIGPRAIVGSGAVVTKDVMENSVVAGNPARFICTLDEYLAKRAEAASKLGIFGSEYCAESISAEDRDEILKRLSSSQGFIE